MRLNRQALTAPGGGGGSGGGGSRRILAATLTYTGTTGTRTNQVSATVTGTLPDPATVLPGGTLQSVEYVVQSLVDYNISVAYLSTGAVNDARVPFYFNFGCGGAGGMDTQSVVGINITSSSTGQTLSAVNRVMNANATFDGDLISTWGFTPTVTLRVGSANFGLEINAGTMITQGIIYNSLQLDGTIKVYYLFE
jgi:hypothetical protein